MNTYLIMLLWLQHLYYYFNSISVWSKCRGILQSLCHLLCSLLSTNKLVSIF